MTLGGVYGAKYVGHVLNSDLTPPTEKFILSNSLTISIFWKSSKLYHNYFGNLQKNKNK